MKKEYKKPMLESFKVTPNNYLDTITMSSGNGQTPGGMGGAKSRDDEEIYESEGGNYGDLW